MIDTNTIVGISASIFTAVSMLPQLIKIAKTRDAQNISVVMLLILITGLTLWIAYGLLIKDWIIVGSNSFSVLVNIAILIMKLKFK